MNDSATRILQKLTGYNDINSVTVDMLKKSSADNPYFPLFQLYLAKKMLRNSTADGKKQLQKTALYFPNELWLRSQLFSLTADAIVHEEPIVSSSNEIALQEEINPALTNYSSDDELEAAAVLASKVLGIKENELIEKVEAPTEPATVVDGNEFENKYVLTDKESLSKSEEAMGDVNSDIITPNEEEAAPSTIEMAAQEADAVGSIQPPVKHVDEVNLPEPIELENEFEFNEEVNKIDPEETEKKEELVSMSEVLLEEPASTEAAPLILDEQADLIAEDPFGKIDSTISEESSDVDTGLGDGIPETQEKTTEETIIMEDKSVTPDINLDISISDVEAVENIVFSEPPMGENPIVGDEETESQGISNAQEEKEEGEPDEHERMFRNIKAMLESTVLEAHESDDGGEIDIDPYHTIDYFASQGIKLDFDQNPNDQLVKNLKKFTHWLKHMKKLGPEDIIEPTPGSETESDIQQLADSSNKIKEVVTEAMARVLEIQGKKGKAIELYNKLSFLYPHKSTYFAAQIKKLKGT